MARHSPGRRSKDTPRTARTSPGPEPNETSSSRTSSSAPSAACSVLAVSAESGTEPGAEPGPEPGPDAGETGESGEADAGGLLSVLIGPTAPRIDVAGTVRSRSPTGRSGSAPHQARPRSTRRRRSTPALAGAWRPTAARVGA